MVCIGSAACRSSYQKPPPSAGVTGNHRKNPAAAGFFDGVKRSVRDLCATALIAAVSTLASAFDLLAHLVRKVFLLLLDAGAHFVALVADDFRLRRAEQLLDGDVRILHE